MDGHLSLLQEMGVYQHHDAISGTARQLVANDYARRLSIALEKNVKSYSKLVDDQIKSMTGFSLPGNAAYEMCYVSNGTVHDCPLGQYTDPKDFEKILNMSVVLHNPSSIK